MFNLSINEWFLWTIFAKIENNLALFKLKKKIFLDQMFTSGWLLHRFSVDKFITQPASSKKKDRFNIVWWASAVRSLIPTKSPLFPQENNGTLGSRLLLLSPEKNHYYVNKRKKKFVFFDVRRRSLSPDFKKNSNKSARLATTNSS